MNKTKRALIALLVFLGVIGLLWGLSLQISFEPTSQAFIDEQTGKKIVAASTVAVITGILLTKSRRRYKITLFILVIIALLMVGSRLASKYSSKQSRLTNVSGAQSKDLLSKSEHRFSILPADLSGYPLMDRKYQNARDSVLESSYTLNSSMHTINIKEFKSKHAQVFNCSSSGTYPCTSHQSNKGLVGCFNVLSEVTCQYYPDNDYVISVETTNASEDEVIAAINALSLVASDDIVLTQ